MTKDSKGHGSNAKGAGRSIDSRIVASQKATGPAYKQERWAKAKADYGKAEAAEKKHRASGNTAGVHAAIKAQSVARVRMAAESTKK